MYHSQIPNFLVLQIGDNFMKILTKIVKLQMYENLHKNVNEICFHLRIESYFSAFH